jgi:hypothetical protein
MGIFLATRKEKTMHTDAELKTWEINVQSHYRTGKLSNEQTVLAEEVAGVVWQTATTVTSKEQCIAELRRVSKNLGHTPTREEYTKHAAISVNTVCRRFGTWNAGLKAARISLRRFMGITKQQVITELKRVANLVGYTPKALEFDKHASVSYATVTNLFGSWNGGLKAAGLDVLRVMGLTKQQMVSELKRVAKKIGHPPTVVEFCTHADMHASTVINVFGSWNKALRSAGLPTARRSKRKA